MLILNLKYRLGLLVFDSGNIAFNKLIKRMKGSKERTRKKDFGAPCAASAQVWWWIFQIFWSITKAQKTGCIYRYVLPWDHKHVFFYPKSQDFSIPFFLYLWMLWFSNNMLLLSPPQIQSSNESAQYHNKMATLSYFASLCSCVHQHQSKSHTGELQ